MVLCSKHPLAALERCAGAGCEVPRLVVSDRARVPADLQQYYNNQGRYPDSRVTLCFGEEFPDPTLRCKLILVQVQWLPFQALLLTLALNFSLLFPIRL